MKSGEAIQPENILESGKYPVYGGNGLRGYTSEYTHDGIFPLVGRQGALCGNVNYGDGKFWASEHAIVVSPARAVNPRWLGEALRAMNLNQYSVSAAQPGLAVEAIEELEIPVPAPEEQVKIARFLNLEGARIDALRKPVS
jgi:type I restriction enzyme S subunit